MSENGAISTKQLKAIAALMQARTVRAAAEAAQISERELYRWLSEPSFQVELKRAGQEAIDTAIRRLATLTGTAIDTLENTMKSKNASPSVHVRAADVVLSRLLNLKELADLEGRVARLEARAGRREGLPGDRSLWTDAEL